MFVGRSRVEITYLYLYMCIFLLEGFGHYIHMCTTIGPDGIGDAFGIEQPERLQSFQTTPTHLSLSKS